MNPDSHRVPDDPVQTLCVSKAKSLETISSGYSLNWDTRARFCSRADLVIGPAKYFVIFNIIVVFVQVEQMLYVLLIRV